jgi:hypothetical protein
MTTSQMRDEERQQLCRDGFPQQVKRDDSDPEVVSVSPIFHVIMSVQLTLQIEQFYDATGPSCTCTALSLSSEGHGVNIGPVGDA